MCISADLASSGSRDSPSGEGRDTSVSRYPAPLAMTMGLHCFSEVSHAANKVSATLFKSSRSGWPYRTVAANRKHSCTTPGRTAQKGPVLKKNALNRLVHNLLELISKGYNPTDLSQQPSCNFPGKQIKILFHNLYVD